MKKNLVLLLVAILLAALSGCGSQGTSLTDTDRDAVLAFSESKTDNMLAAMNANDYTMFSADFDLTMLSAMTKVQFDSLKKDRDAKLGLYVSRQVSSVIRQGEYFTVIYDAVFEKDDAVIVRVVFNYSEPHLISGLWFSK